MNSHRNRWLGLVAVVATFGGAQDWAAAQVLEPGDGDFMPVTPTNTIPEAGEATVTVENGTYTVDASDGKNYLDVPAEGRSFVTMDDFLLWAADEFGGEIIYDAGAAVGVHGIAVTYGQPFSADGNSEQAVPVDDVVAAAVAGWGGIVTIAGEQYCLREDGCLGIDAFKARPPETASNCDPTSTFCIESESFDHSFPPLIPIYRSKGTDTEQTRGGYAEDSHFCWKLFIPWICTSKMGSNELGIQNAYHWSEENGLAQGTAFAEHRVANATSIKVKHWNFFAAPKVNEAGGPGASFGCQTGCAVKGVCGVSNGLDPRDRTLFGRTETSAGDVTGVCD